MKGRLINLTKMASRVKNQLIKMNASPSNNNYNDSSFESFSSKKNSNINNKKYTKDKIIIITNKKNEEANLDQTVFLKTQK